MTRLALFVGFVLLVAAAVWYAVTHFVQPGPPRGPAILTLAPLGAPCGSGCGHERWAVKTLSDADREDVDFRPISETIEHLVEIDRPTKRPNDHRAGPAERTTYDVIGCLGVVDDRAQPGIGVHYRLVDKVENDRDIHLVIGGLVNPRISMIAEIPNPECSGVCPSGLGSLYAQLRVTLDSILEHGTPSPACNNDVPLVEITGVGFFDHEHGQIGAAPNELELHPVLALKVAEPPTPSGTQRTPPRTDTAPPTGN